jgi:hypothetical protein
MKRAVVIRAGRINVRSATGTNNKITFEVFEKTRKRRNNNFPEGKSCVLMMHPSPPPKKN